MEPRRKFLIVESPTKAKKISEFIGKDWKVIATFGHIRDLPQDSMGFDISDLIEGRINLHFKVTNHKVARFLKKNINNKEDEVIIASDPDREGEAIAYHVATVLGLKDPKRAVFYEVTKNAVLSAIRNPTRINMNLVHAQISRRVIDRLVGYTVSPVLWRIRYNSSAGRVQSVALHLIATRWNEVISFDKKPYFVVVLDFGDFKAFLYERDKDGRSKIKQFFRDSDAQELIQKIKELSISKFRRGLEFSQPKPPYITSSLLQDAKSILGFSSDFAMKVAQELFESGYITYHRTDSFRISSEGLALASDFFKEFDLSDIQSVGRIWRSRITNAQESHECIRPTTEGFERFKKLWTNRIEDIYNTRSISPQDKMIYIICLRFFSSQAKKSIYDTVEMEFVPDNVEPNLYFKAKVIRLKFDGFLRLWMIRDEPNTDEITEGERAYAKALSLEFERNIRIRSSGSPSINLIKRYTQPPPLYTEASLIRELERLGVGRPSTYATIIKTLKSRGYIIEESGKLIPTPDGLFQDKVLTENFPDICSAEFTAKMEEELDRISRGEVSWIESIRNSTRAYMEKFELFRSKIGDKIDELKVQLQTSSRSFQKNVRSQKKSKSEAQPKQTANKKRSKQREINRTNTKNK